MNAAIVAKTAAWAFYHKSGPYMDIARNEVVGRFYEPQHMECDRLLMIDSDIEFEPEDITTLEEDDLPIVSGVYYNVYDGVTPLPVVYAWGVTGEGRRKMGPVKKWPDCEFDEEYEEPIVVAAGVGAGFLMVKREVFDALGEIHGPPCPWFGEDIRNGEILGEDLCFCLRASDAGFPTHVDRRVQVAHHKSVRIGGSRP